MEIESPISMTDLADQLGVDATMVVDAASRHTGRRGVSQTFVGEHFPHLVLTVGAAQTIADEVQP